MVKTTKSINECTNKNTEKNGFEKLEKIKAVGKDEAKYGILKTCEWSPTIARKEPI